MLESENTPQVVYTPLADELNYTRLAAFHTALAELSRQHGYHISIPQSVEAKLHQLPRLRLEFQQAKPPQQVQPEVRSAQQITDAYEQAQHALNAERARIEKMLAEPYSLDTLKDAFKAPAPTQPPAVTPDLAQALKTTGLTVSVKPVQAHKPIEQRLKEAEELSAQVAFRHAALEKCQKRALDATNLAEQSQDALKEAQEASARSLKMAVDAQRKADMLQTELDIALQQRDDLRAMLSNAHEEHQQNARAAELWHDFRALVNFYTDTDNLSLTLSRELTPEGEGPLYHVGLGGEGPGRKPYTLAHAHGAQLDRCIRDVKRAAEYVVIGARSGLIEVSNFPAGIARALSHMAPPQPRGAEDKAP